MAERDEQERLLAKVLAARRAMLARRWLPGGTEGEEGRGWRPRTIAFLAAGVLGIVVLGVLAFVRASPAAESPPPLPSALRSSASGTKSASASAAPSSATRRVVVSVVGKVTDPGLVRLPEGARVADAITAAGGRIGRVEVGKLNLARKVADGEQLFVGIPVPDWAEPNADSVPSGGGTSGPSARPGSTKTDLNSANAARLSQLPGIGEATAKRILDWREQHHRFNTVQQLQDVSGIGAAKFDKLKDLVVAR